MNWASISATPVADGIERQMVFGERVMVCRLRLAAHVVTPVHAHPHEQITMVEPLDGGAPRQLTLMSSVCVPERHAVT